MSVETAQGVASRPAAREGFGTGGAWAGTDGPVRDLLLGWAVIAAITVPVAAINALSVQADRPRLPSWEPWVWELTSAAALIALAWGPWRVLAAAPVAWLEGGWSARARFLGAHLCAALAFSAAHVAGLSLLRRTAYAFVGAVYRDRPDVFSYELRKDVLSYAAFAAIFWLARRLREAKEAPLRPVSFDIRDGARLIRAPLSEILAAASAGNYVEFVLADGRRPLMRATLAAVEAELGGFGFVRVHRSWLVNTGRVTGLTPAGSGDWTVELSGATAPLSRRYPGALARLRAGLPLTGAG
jgi:DNA-binding LytR/AlgR family response regulator